MTCDQQAACIGREGRGRETVPCLMKGPTGNKAWLSITASWFRFKAPTTATPPFRVICGDEEFTVLQGGQFTVYQKGEREALARARSPGGGGCCSLCVSCWAAAVLEFPGAGGRAGRGGCAAIGSLL